MAKTVASGDGKQFMGLGRPTLAVTGDSSALVIDGHVEGVIAEHEKQITIGRHGRVKGNVQANSVTVLGHVIGTIRSDGVVALANGAEVEGDIVCGRVHIDDGACFSGKIHMGDPAGWKSPDEPVGHESDGSVPSSTVAV